MNLSDEISRLAQEYDSAHEADAEAVRTLTQGLLAGTMLQSMAKGTAFLKLNDVEITKDANGNYEHYFVVVTRAGHRIRVSVEVE